MVRVDTVATTFFCFLALAGYRCRGREERVAGPESRCRHHAPVSGLHPAALPADAKHDMRRKELDHHIPDPAEHDAGVPIAAAVRRRVTRRRAAIENRSATCRRTAIRVQSAVCRRPAIRVHDDTAIRIHCSARRRAAICLRSATWQWVSCAHSATCRRIYERRHDPHGRH